jgi:ribose transport system permease protein
MIRARRLLASESVGLITVLVAGLIVMTLLSPSFLTAFNLYVLLRSACVSLLVAFAQMICLGVGQMNLSLGGLGGLIAILLGGMLEVLGIPLPIAIMAALALGVMGGVINGLLTVRTGINGFIITLATASAFTGINYGLTEAVPFYKMPPALVAFGTGRIGPIPYLLIVPMIVAPALSLFLFRTLPGRRLLAVGGNSYAAALSGISAAGAVVLAHCISGTLAAIAAILAVAQLGTAQPLIGSDWLLISFAAPIIGGTVLGGGHVSVVGASIAVLIVALIQNGLILAKVDPYWVQFLLGALVLTTVGLNRWHAVRTRKAMG